MGSSNKSLLFDYRHYRTKIGNEMKQFCQLFHMHIVSGQNLKLQWETYGYFRGKLWGDGNPHAKQKADVITFPQ